MCLIIQLVLFHSDYPEYLAILGQEASLPCNVTAPSSEDALALILWYRNGGKNAIYTVDARSTNNWSTGRLFAAPAVKDRVRLDCGVAGSTSAASGTRLTVNASSNPTLCVLRIRPVTLDDGMMEYRCRVDFKRGRTINYNMHLNLIG